MVAGFSCVDFSLLNNKTLKLQDGGESGDTFGAIRDYANVFRPKIIILENVCNAPWDLIKNELMPEIGYAAVHARVDTKLYYIPHTRQRGYMICVDAKIFNKPDKVLSDWEKLMKSFQRPASSSVESFLLPEDDDRAIRARTELTKFDSRRTKEIDWARCQSRHQEYRDDLGLGHERPVTHWQNSGTCKPIDFMWQGWNIGQVERVWDCQDVSYLRNLNRGFDEHFKM